MPDNNPTNPLGADEETQNLIAASEKSLNAFAEAVQHLKNAGVDVTAHEEKLANG